MRVSGPSNPWNTYGVSKSPRSQRDQFNVEKLVGQASPPAPAPEIGSAKPSGPAGPDTVQFNTQLLVALLNAQEGQFGGQQNGGDIQSGQAHQLLAIRSRISS
jgi:hypothetical protein